MTSESKKILFVTTNSLATNPRLVKEIRACLLYGYKVSVISFSFENWSKPINEELIREFQLYVNLVLLPGDNKGKLAWLQSTMLSILSRILIIFGSRDLAVLSMSLFKRSGLLFKILQKKKENHDWVIAHNLGAFVPAMLYAKKHDCKLGIDIEDYHPGETAILAISKKVEYLMRNVMMNANAITAASPLILQQSLGLLLGKVPTHAVINNVFSLQQQLPFFDMLPIPLKLVWFSQTVGLNRGIQDVILAMNLIYDSAVHLTIIGHCTSEIQQRLKNLMVNGTHRIFFVPPITERELIRLCSQQHIGMALETGEPLNRDLCLTNKLFVYLLAGNAIIASKTAAQQKFINEFPGLGEVYSSGDRQYLARLLIQFMHSPKKLEKARRKAYYTAKTHFNWEEEEKEFITLYGLKKKENLAKSR
jgi:glycosyltransferase involved in cell wall biosynthesis